MAFTEMKDKQQAIKSKVLLQRIIATIHVIKVCYLTKGCKEPLPFRIDSSHGEKAVWGNQYTLKFYHFFDCSLAPKQTNFV